MKKLSSLMLVALALSLVLAACAAPTPEKVVETVVVEKEVVVTPTPKAGCPDSIVICWTPPDITGVFRTATDFFNLSALDARSAGLNVSLVSSAYEPHRLRGPGGHH